MPPQARPCTLPTHGALQEPQGIETEPEPQDAAHLPGDREGRRLARRRAQLLAEAGRLGHALRVLLDRAAFDTEPVRELLASIAERERGELLRAQGRIEPRKRFKGGPIRAAADADRNLLFIDESGKSGVSTDEAWSFFALAGISMRGAAADDYRARADDLKLRFFGRVDITFHEPVMRRHDGVFNFSGNESRTRAFDRAVDALVDGSEFVAFGVGIRKAAFERDFTETGLDPYLPTDVYSVAIQMLLERYVDFLAQAGSERSLARVTFESQGPREDAEHQRDFVDILLNGTQWVADSAFRQWLETGLRFTPKQGSDPMELADLMSRDLYEWVRDGCTTWPGRWQAISRRVYCRGDGLMGKFGVKVFPDSDIREAVLAHRETVRGAEAGSRDPTEN